MAPIEMKAPSSRKTTAAISAPTAEPLPPHIFGQRSKGRRRWAVRLKGARGTENDKTDAFFSLLFSSCIMLERTDPLALRLHH